MQRYLNVFALSSLMLLLAMGQLSADDDELADRGARRLPSAADLPTRGPDATEAEAEASSKSRLDANPADRLAEVLRQAKESLEYCQHEIHDYTCTLVAQERIDGRLHPLKSCQAKVRHERGPRPEKASPVSVYLKFERPQSLQGREVLLVSGENDGKLLVRKGGPRLAFLTALIDPTSPLAMNGNRYSIHQFGIQRLIERMLDFGKQELSNAACQVKVCKDIQVNGRSCTTFEIKHTLRHDHLPFHLARIYIDQELQLPIGFEAFDWPRDDGQPILLERYLYRDLKLNVGLTDADFDKSNPDYRFNSP